MNTSANYTEKTWTVYLSGEIHTDWRAELIAACEAENLPLDFSGPVLDHDSSDNCGVEVLGAETSAFWKDHKGAKLNAIRTRTLIEEADIVIVRFGEKYRQWNAAFEAGYATAIHTPVIVVHPEEFTHALKEVDATALAVCETLSQIVRCVKYVCEGQL